MSKINAVRLININYNNNAIRISDEVMHFQGRSTLISLRNGGGKSVLVQMMTAPFVQKRYRNTKERPFASYFTSGRPSFILVEWVLDQGAGYVMTGMMVRQSQSADDGEDLEIINFISEYKQPGPQDLHHLPVIEKTKDDVTLKSFAVCRQLFDSYKKDRSIRFFYYDMNNSAQSKQYFDKLLEYGINYREWQTIIKKINEEESGLSKLFADCKDEKGLVEKWFLESVESKLNRDKNRMQEFREILEKYICLYRDNQSKIKRRDTIQKFDEEADRIAERGGNYVKASEASEGALRNIIAYIQELKRILAQTDAEYYAEQAHLEELREKLQLVSHQKNSAEYYLEADQIASLEESIASFEASLEELSIRRDSWIRTQHLLSCAKQQETVDKDKEELARAEALLEACRKESRDLTPERDYLGYCIRRHLENKIQEIEDRICATERDITEANAAELQANAEIDEQDRLIRNASGEEGRLKSGIDAYDREETCFNKNWQENLSRNIMGEYEAGALIMLKSQLDTRKKSETKTRTQKKHKLEDLGGQICRQERIIDDLNKKDQEYAQRLSEAQSAKKAYDSELDERRKILQYLELREANLYDRDRILRVVDSKAAELDAAVGALTKEEADLSDKIQSISTGQTVEISPELTDMFESLGIHIVYGMEWLKRNGQTEEENLELVRRHPFLPYALIMTEAELCKLEEAEGTVYTSFPVPIVTRESLAAANEAASESLPALGSVHFYMLFNQNLLNEEKLEQLIMQMQRQLEKKREDLSRRKQEDNDYLIRRNTLSRQKVTEAGYQEIQEQVAELEQKLAGSKADFAAAKQMLAELNSQKETLTDELNKLEKLLDSLDREESDLQELTSRYEAYLEQRKKLYECRKLLREAETRKEKLKEQAGRLREKQYSLNKSVAELQYQLDAQNQQLSGFSNYRETVRPDCVTDELLLEFAFIQARYLAITQEVSKKEQELEKDRSRAAERLQRSEKELERLAKKYRFEEGEWLVSHYSVSEEENAEKETVWLTEQIEEVKKHRNEADKEKALAEQRRERCISQMHRECGKSDPLPRAEIPQIDFEQTGNDLLRRKKEHEGISAMLAERRQMLDSNVTSLAEYQDFELREPRLWEEEFAGFSKEELRDFTGRIKRAYLQCQEDETKARDELVRMIGKIMRMEDFREDFYKKPLDAILAAASDGRQVMNQLDLIRRAYHDLIEKLMADIAMVEQEKAHIVTLLQAYVKQVHEQMGKIDKNSTIQIRGRAIKMLKIGLPVWADNESLYHVRVEDMIEDITGRGLEILNKNGSLHEYMGRRVTAGEPGRNESLHEFIGKRLTTRELYNAVVGIGNVHIQLYKIEEQRELQISWREVAKNSGGEGFLSAFVILSSLLYYMRRDDTDIFADRNEGKVLLMDNPFAQTNASHLLKPLMDVARKNNTQLICLTGLGGDSIYGRFDNIYALNLIAASLSNGVQYLKATHSRGEEPEAVTFARLEVSDDDGQMELVF